MRQSYLKNAALLTGSDVVLRLAGMGLRIWLANELGGEGMGLYQLVLAVYSLFVTLATAGVSVAATRLMAEELSGPDSARGAARGMLRRLLAAGLVLGLFAAALQLTTANLAARLWLGDVRAVGALRVSALGMPWMAVSAVLRGFFIARRHVAPNVFSQLTEQTVRIVLVALALTRTEGLAVGVRCMLVLGATAVSEAVSALCMLAFYRRDARSAFAGQKAVRPADPARRLWEILWPVEGGRVLASALHTAENMLVPACLAVYLINAGGRTVALEQYGELKGMALPLLTFPFGLLGSLSVLLMPEITQAHILGQTERLKRTFGPDVAAHRLFFRAGRGAVLGVGTAAGTAFVPKCGCRILSGNAGSCHAADVSGKHGGRCHERGRGAEGGLPLQRVGFHPAHWRGGGAAAALWHEGLFGSDPAFQPVHLRGQHRASAVFQRHAACIPPLAGCTGTGSCAGRGGWHGVAEAACGWVCGSAAFAAGRVGRRRLRYHRSVPAGGMAAGPWRGSSRALGCAPARQTEKIEGVWQRIQIFWTFCSVLSII